MTFTRVNAAVWGIIFEGTLYGAYTVLFILYLVLRHRSHRLVDGPLTLAHIMLFGLCTTSVCLDIPGNYFGIVPDAANVDTSNKFDVGSTVVFALIDYLAQMILVSSACTPSAIVTHQAKLYRCWIIWDKRWVVVAAPGFLALASLGGGFALVALANSPLWITNIEKINQLYNSTGIMTNSTSLVANALTTSLIVTKILSISREVHHGLGSDSNRSLRLITAMLIESGLLMLAFQLAFVVLFSTESPAFDIISNPITQIYGITPTLLSLRVAMGSAYERTTEKTRSLRFAHSGGAATETTGPSTSVAGVQSRVADVELNNASNENAADAMV